MRTSHLEYQSDLRNHIKSSRVRHVLRMKKAFEWGNIILAVSEGSGGRHRLRPIRELKEAIQAQSDDDHTP